MITVLAGNNWFRIKQELGEAIAAFRKEHGDLAIERVNGSEVTWAEIMSAVSGLSLFSEDKLVVITDLFSNKEAKDKISSLIELASKSTELILVDTSLDKRSAYYKTLKKLPNFKEYNELSEDALVQWVLEYAKSLDSAIDLADARYLVERVGSSQTLLERELVKLSLYGKRIDRKVIDELTEATPASTIFNLVESAFSGNVKNALKLYEEQRTLRKESQAIYGMLVWQMHLVAICAAAGGKNLREVANDTGLNSYSLGKAQTVARRMGAQKVQSFLKLLRDIEITSKSQTYDLDEALKYAITSLAY